MAIDLVHIVSIVIIRFYGLFLIGTPWMEANFESFLPIFLLGSLLGLSYHRLEERNQPSKMNDLIASDNRLGWMTSSLCYLTFVIGGRSHAFLATTNEDLYYYSLFWSMFLLLMLCTDPNNAFTNMLNESSVLRLFGKFSFGFYLFHILARELIQKHLYGLFPIATDQVALIVALSFVFGALFFYLIENISMKLAHILTRRVNSFTFW